MMTVEFIHSRRDVKIYPVTAGELWALAVPVIGWFIARRIVKEADFEADEGAPANPE
jgi:hypothetical protein